MKRTAVALTAVAVWALTAALGVPHRVLPVSAPAGQFAAARAEQLLAQLLGDERSHPVSSAANGRVRARIMQQFAVLGIDARIYPAFVCNPERGFERIACATVHDLIAPVLPGSGRAIYLMAHYDSVPAGPGASDNMSGVAALLEAARALKAGHTPTLHPVIALITDGEEAGMLGAYAFLRDERLRESVGAVVNVDARGTAGPSLLFQTSAGDGALVDLYVHSVPAPATSSLYAEIYRHLPNDTDLTPFLQAGFPGFNFAFIDQVRYYHSSLDQRRQLDPASLQMQGDNLLGVVRALAHTPYHSLHGRDAIYLSIFNRVVPRLAATAALPLALGAWAGIVLAAWLEARRRPLLGVRAVAPALLMPPGLILGSALIGFALESIARLISGSPDPSYAYPIALRLALAFGVWTVALVVTRRLETRAAAASGWLWMATLGVLSAALLPGASPYFILPALIAAVLLLAAALLPGGWLGSWGRAARVAAGVVGLVVWTGLMSAGESVMGLRLHLLFTVPAALGLIAMASLLACSPREPGRAPDRRRSIPDAAAAASALAALMAAVTAGLLPAFSAASPERLNLIYFQNPQRACWIADSIVAGKSAAPLPQSLSRARPFRLGVLGSRLLGGGSRYSTAARAAQFALPSAMIHPSASGPPAADPTAAAIATPAADGGPGKERTALIQLRGSEDTDAMVLWLPARAAVRRIALRGQQLAAPPGWNGDTRLLCLSRDCRDETVTVTWAGPRAELEFAEERYGLPPFGTALARARGAAAVPSQDGDAVVLQQQAWLP